MAISKEAIGRVRAAAEAVCRIKVNAVTDTKLGTPTGRSVARAIAELTNKMPGFKTIRINRDDESIIFYDLIWVVKGEDNHFSPSLLFINPNDKSMGAILRIWVDSRRTAHITTNSGYKGTITLVTPGDLVEWIVEYLDEIN
ncbi:hypothetical protein D5W64_12105 [Salmonella enterica subsp. enterica serovar Saintpaul]|nr:hypothetical protein [Salmonella enterica subsp. enterica serovar Saintpaul]